MHVENAPLCTARMPKGQRGRTLEQLLQLADGAEQDVELASALLQSAVQSLPGTVQRPDLPLQGFQLAQGAPSIRLRPNHLGQGVILWAQGTTFVQAQFAPEFLHYRRGQKECMREVERNATFTIALSGQCLLPTYHIFPQREIGRNIRWAIFGDATANCYQN